MLNPEIASSKNILLIDDSTAELRLLMEMMSSRRIRVNVAFNGQDGFNKATIQVPDLILLDVIMPGIDGFTTCLMLKNNDRTRYIPVIFLSAANEVENRIYGLSLGAVDYISKPFSEQEVLARVGIHLNLTHKSDGISVVANANNESSVDMTQRDAILIHAATSYLKQHLQTPPAPDALAKLLGTNEKRLNQAFNTRFSMPVFTWLREERLRQARELLALTAIPIGDIAEHLGYSSAANFSKAFHLRFDCSPKELRIATQKRWQQQECDER